MGGKILGKHWAVAGRFLVGRCSMGGMMSGLTLGGGYEGFLGERRTVGIWTLGLRKFFGLTLDGGK